MPPPAASSAAAGPVPLPAPDSATGPATGPAPAPESAIAGPTVPATEAARGAGRGIALATAGFAIFSLMDVLIKLLTARYPVPQVLFFHALFSMGPILAYALATGGVWRNIRTRRWGLHALRAGCGMVSGMCSFFAYSRLPIADVYAIAFAAPLFITALSVPLLGEKVGWRRWTAVAVGFGGILIMLRPGAGVVEPAALAALTAAFLYAFAMVLSRRMRGTETSISFAFYSCCATLTVNALLLPGVWMPPTLPDLGLSLAGGLLGGTALICLLNAFRMAPAAVVAPFQYSQLLWGVTYGYLIFGDVPAPILFLGGGIVIASGLYILHRETVVARRPS